MARDNSRSSQVCAVFLQTWTSPELQILLACRVSADGSRLSILIEIINAGPKSSSFVTLITTHSCSCRTMTRCTVSVLATHPTFGRWFQLSSQVLPSRYTNGDRQLPPYGIPSRVCLYCRSCVRYFTDILTEFVAENPQYLAPNNSMDFLSDNGGQSYNLCHCKWSIFYLSYNTKMIS